MIDALISLIIYIIILALLWWLANYVLDQFPLPEPAYRIFKVAITVIFVLIAIYILLSVFGIGGISEVPRFCFERRGP
jgi:hypothetical protein